MAERRKHDDQKDDRNRKSEWLDSADEAAYDPVTRADESALSMLGGSSLRDGAIGGVSDPVRSGNAGPHERPRPEDEIAPGPRRNPPLDACADIGDGGLSESGGVAGGVGPGVTNDHSIARAKINRSSEE